MLATSYTSSERFQTFEFSKIDFAKIFITHFWGPCREMGFFWLHEFENIDFLKKFWSKNFFFLKVFQVVEEGLGGISIDFFGVLRLLGAYKRMQLELYVMANIGASEQILDGFSMQTSKKYPSYDICVVIQR